MPRHLDLRPLVPLALLLAVGCGNRIHQQYDFGRAYTAAASAQADLTRLFAADAAYALSGREGLQLRILATESTTDTESGEAESVAKISVQ